MFFLARTVSGSAEREAKSIRGMNCITALSPPTNTFDELRSEADKSTVGTNTISASSGTCKHKVFVHTPLRVWERKKKKNILPKKKAEKIRRSLKLHALSFQRIPREETRLFQRDEGKKEAGVDQQPSPPRQGHAQSHDTAIPTLRFDSTRAKI